MVSFQRVSIFIRLLFIDVGLEMFHIYFDVSSTIMHVSMCLCVCVLCV